MAALAAAKAKVGDAFDREVGGFVVSPASGKPVRIRGKLVYHDRPPGWPSDVVTAEQRVAVIEFGRGNLLVLTPQLTQIVDPQQLRWGPIDPARFTTWVLKSRAHFRRGFDDSGYAKTIVIVDAPGPYLGTVHLDALSYRNVDLGKLFPFNAGGLEAARKSIAR